MDFSDAIANIREALDRMVAEMSYEEIRAIKEKYKNKSKNENGSFSEKPKWNYR